MKKNKKLLIIIILFISIGFAILTASLRINADVSFQPSKWDVHFENIEVNTDSSCTTMPIIDDEKTTVTFSSTINEPGDFFEFYVDVVNDGTMDATLNLINKSTLSEDQEKYINYEVKYFDNRELKKDDILHAGYKEKLIVRVEYKYDITELKSLGMVDFSLSLNYVKRDLEKDYEEEVWSIDYTGREHEFIAPKAGIYKLEVWGAQGGSIEQYSGGYGGYSVGNVTLIENQSLFINVGGEGVVSKVGGQTIPGSYNGGGAAKAAGSNGIGGGGGATHISFFTGLLSTFEYKQQELLIVAGGGGAGAYPYFSEINYYYAYGGHGGGFTGSSATGYSGYVRPDNWNPCQGGSQTLAEKRLGGQGTFYSAVGTFGQGGNYSADNSYAAAGGGGGYYGGDGCRNFGSGGGSGYIGNERLKNKSMYCYNCEESEEDSTKTISISNVSNYSISQYAKKGNGYAKITYLG